MGDSLFSPLTIRGTTFKNRIVTSPMWQYRGEDGFASDWHLMHLGRFAEGGAALVFQEATTVDPLARGTAGDIGIWDDAFVPGLSRIVDVIHEGGALAGIQLGHPGRKARRLPPWHGPSVPDGTVDDPSWQLLAPSPPRRAQEALPWTVMTLGDIARVKDLWRGAVCRAVVAGYDVIEIHAAHGYLLHTFLSPESNTREDDYGGSFEGRVRLLREIVTDAREIWPADKPLFVRLSCVDGAGWTMRETLLLTHILTELGVDVIDCSSGGLTNSSLAGTPPTYGYQVPYAEEVKRNTPAKSMAVGLIVHPSQAHQIIAGEQADLVALGRELLLNPSWPIDAARKLGVDVKFDSLPPRLGYWLNRRAETVAGLQTSTDGFIEVPWRT